MDDDLSADLYEITQAMTDRAGYAAYEISNHARAPEHRSVHNRIYWASGDGVGVGPGAHGRLTADGRWATEAAEKPGNYIQQVKSHGLGWSAVEALDPLAQARERIAMGLRVSEGLALADVEERGLALDAEKLAAFEGLGLVRRS